MIQNTAGTHCVYARRILTQVIKKISTQELGSFETEHFFDDETLQVRARIRLNGRNGCGAGLLEEVRMTAFQRAELQEALALHAAELRNGPGDSRVFEHREIARVTASEGLRQPRPPLALEDIERVLRRGR